MKYNWTHLLEEMSEYAAEEELTQHIFSQKYQQRKEQILKQAAAGGNGMQKSAAAILIGICCMIPVTVLGASILGKYLVRYEATGKFQDTYTFEKASTQENEVIYVKMVTDFPQEYQDLLTVNLYYAKNTNKIVEDYVTYREDVVVKEHPAVYMERKFTKTEKSVLLFFEEFGYAVKIAANEDMEKEKLLELAEMVRLEKTTLEQADEAIYIINGTEYLSGEPETQKQPAIFQIGEMVETGMFDGISMQSGTVQVKVTGAEWLESLASLKNGNFRYPQIMDKYVNEDGTLKSYTRQTWTRGDGVETIPQLVETKTISQKILKVTFEVKNMESATAYYSIGTHIGLSMPQNSKELIFERGENLFTAFPYPVWIDGHEQMEVAIGENITHPFLAKIPPKETVVMQAVFVVDEDLVGEIYLGIGRDGTKMVKIK